MPAEGVCWDSRDGNVLVEYASLLGPAEAALIAEEIHGGGQPGTGGSIDQLWSSRRGTTKLG